MALAVAPGAGLAQERGRAASPEELWSDYPLEPDEKAGEAGEEGAAPADARTAGGRSREAPVDADGEDPDDDGWAPAALVLLGLLAVALLGLLAASALAVVRRHERSVPVPGSRGPPPRIASPVALDERGVPASPATPRPASWTAEIQWSNDAGAPRFRVVATPPGGGTDLTLAESPPLEWPPRSDAAGDSLVRAVDGLERAAVEAGWQPTEPGASWFARRFVWLRSDRAPGRTLAGQRRAGTPDVVRMEEQDARSR